MRRRCLCSCHTANVGDRHRTDGADVTDPLEAVIACSQCQYAHCDALLDPTLPRDQRLLRERAAVAKILTAIAEEPYPYLPPQNWKARDATDGETLNTNDDGEDGG